MKLLRHGPAGAEKPGLLHSDGTLRDLSAIVSDIGGDVLSDAGLAKIRAADPARLPMVAAGASWALRGGHRQIHLHRPELFRPCRRNRR